MDEDSHIFFDSKQREIKIFQEPHGLIVKNNNLEIGCFEFDTNDDNHDCLIHMQLDSNFQRSGIGTKVLSFAEELYCDFLVIDHLSTEGAALLNKFSSVRKFNHEICVYNGY